ncbi:N-acyl-L-amino acid amidohydrolase [Lactococcus hodotermopsidis]|uniref:N-acyl-L-amino acid amidohydrolase n=1 Tax=Pseudolactococcus hodotermopsidis TaxID=2709157 RepID=A0A6A0BDH0_9LACT|nr:amidohydrolase [Lactococcus hodotermopsidis]GFH41867.1 N-acyl-L-amino acid amidohydrolase [Lactococcus hodotermopsidis]
MATKEELLAQLPVKEMIAWRRHLHAHPELSFQEFETTKYIISILETFPNLELQRPTPTGVIAILKGGKPGKTIALRADIDALPIREEADVEFVSENEAVMHACGHDTHTSMMLGAVKVITQMQAQIAGTIKFLFQPAEEVPPGGAKEFVKAGVMDDVDQVFGLHIFPLLPTGAIGYKYGALTASSDTLNLTIHGVGAHASVPETSVDVITIGAEIISNVNNIIARRISPLDPALISWGEFKAGETHNVIPDTAIIKASIRTRNPEIRTKMRDMVEQTVKGICDAYGATYDFDFLYGYSSVQNAKTEMDLVRVSAAKVVGEEAVFELPALMGGEDFSAYTDVKPGCFFGLGGGLAKDGYGYFNHHPKFKIDENALPVGTAVFVQLVKDLMIEG